MNYLFYKIILPVIIAYVFCWATIYTLRFIAFCHNRRALIKALFRIARGYKIVCRYYDKDLQQRIFVDTFNFDEEAVKMMESAGFTIMASANELNKIIEDNKNNKSYLVAITNLN